MPLQRLQEPFHEVVIILAVMKDLGPLIAPVEGTEAEDPSMDKAPYNETANVIKIDADLDVNVMVDMLLWEACNAENQEKFKGLKSMWANKSPAEFGNAKAEVEEDARRCQAQD